MIVECYNRSTTSIVNKHDLKMVYTVWVSRVSLTQVLAVETVDKNIERVGTVWMFYYWLTKI